MGKYFLKSLCALDYFLKSKFLWTISIYGVKYFQQSAMNLCLEHIEAQHSWILWLLGKYFLKSLCALDYFSKSKFLWAISKCGVKYFEQSAMDLCLECIEAQHSWILWLMGKYLLKSLCALDYFSKSKFLWAISKCGAKYFEQGAMDLCLECIEAQHSWISWLLGKYLLKSLCALDYFSNWNFLWAIPKCGVKCFEHSTMDLCLHYIEARHSWISC